MMSGKMKSFPEFLDGLSLAEVLVGVSVATLSVSIALPRLALMLVNVAFMEFSVATFKLWNIRLYSRRAMAWNATLTALSIACSLYISIFTITRGDDEEAQSGSQWYAPFVMATIRVLTYLYFGQRRVFESFRVQRGRELAWGYNTFLLAFANAEQLTEEIPGGSVVSPKRLLLLPKSCTGVDHKTEPWETVYEEDRETPFEVRFGIPLPYQDLFKERISLRLCRMPKRGADESDEANYHYFVYDFPTTLKSSLVCPEETLDPFLLEHFREDFVSEVEAILKQDGQDKVVRIVQYDDSVPDALETAVMSMLEEMDAAGQRLTG